MIQRLGLQPLGFEGGWYKENVRSEQSMRFDGDRGRSLHTAIYYLLTPTSRSLMHRLRSDEVYHFYLGDPVDMLLLHPDGGHERVCLGHDLSAGQEVQRCVPRGVWQGSVLRHGGRYALMGTTMSPGFQLDDFELGDRSELVVQYPALERDVKALTPEVFRRAGWEVVAAGFDLLHADLRGPEALAAGLRAAPWDPAFEDRLQDAHRRRVQAVLQRLEGEGTGRIWGVWYGLDAASRVLKVAGAFDGPPVHGTVHFRFTSVHDASGFVACVLDRAFEQPGVERAVVEPSPPILAGYRSEDGVTWTPDGRRRSRPDDPPS